MSAFWDNREHDELKPSYRQERNVGRDAKHRGTLLAKRTDLPIRLGSAKFEYYLKVTPATDRLGGIVCHLATNNTVSTSWPAPEPAHLPATKARGICSPTRSLK